MKKTILSFTLIIAILNIAYSQEKDNYYQLSKDGNIYAKPKKYVLLSGDYKKIINSNKSKLTFYLNSEIFEHHFDLHSADTCTIHVMNRIKLSNISDLRKSELAEHNEKTKLENIKIPPPPSHYNLKVFLLEKFGKNRIIKYEVKWIYKTH